MSDSIGGSLNAAYEAIKAKDLSKARDLLSEYLVDNPNDVDAWWLYSYAVTDVEQGRKALETVLRLDPAYPGARDLLIELETTSPSQGAEVSPAVPMPVAVISRAAEAPKLTATIDPDSEEAAEFGFADEEPQEAGRFRRLLIAALAAAVVLAIVAVVFILPNLNPPAPTVVANTNSAPTDVPLIIGATDAATQDASGDVTDVPTTEAPTAETAATEVSTSEDATVESPTAEGATVESPTTEPVAATDTAVEPTIESASGDPLQAMADALSTFNVVLDSTTIDATQLGQTASISICASTSELRSVIPAALSAIAAISMQVPADVQAVAARFVNCSGDGAVLRHVALTTADAQAFAQGTLSETDLRSRFVPLP